MRKFVVLAVDDTKKYLTCLPIVMWAWEKIGWTPLLVLYGNKKYMSSVTLLNGFPMLEGNPLSGLKNSTLAQVSRLYVAGSEIFQEGDYIMTSDADMLPLSDYWDTDPSKITVWGHDLTGFGHYPICYIGMTRERWIEVMGITNSNMDALITRDIEWWKSRFDNIWLADQDIVTAKINETEFEVKHVYRGVYPNGYAMNRVDRSAWHLNHNQFVDCHMFQIDNLATDEGATNFARTVRLLNKIWPAEDFGWYIQLVRDICKI